MRVFIVSEYNFEHRSTYGRFVEILVARLLEAGIEIVNRDYIRRGRYGYDEFVEKGRFEIAKADIILLIANDYGFRNSKYWYYLQSQYWRVTTRILPIIVGDFNDAEYDDIFIKRRIAPYAVRVEQVLHFEEYPYPSERDFQKLLRTLALLTDEPTESSPLMSVGAPVASHPVTSPFLLRAMIAGTVVITIGAVALALNLRSPGPSIDTTATAIAVANGTISVNASQTALAAIPSSTPSNTPRPSVTPTPTSNTVALIPVRIVSVSGIEIGNGTVRVFAPESIEASQSTTIELELNLDYRYITPTPAGPITPIAITPITSTPRPGRATATPREPIYSENNITTYQRMGASLNCPPDRFTGCDTDKDPTDAQLVDWEKGAKWSWIIAPIKDVSGLQNLRLELWTIIRINDDPEQADVVWDYPLQIEVKSPAEAVRFVEVIQDNVGIVITGLFGIVVALIGAGYFRRRKAANTRKKSVSKKVVKPKVFISYRRVGGASAAQSIKDRLTVRGADVFLDVHDINEGRFEEIIKMAIEQREHFVLVLAPDTLESDWVVKETLYAIQHNQKIIPVLVDGFKLDVSKLPAGLESIKGHNAINLTGEYYDAGIDKLARFIGLETEKGR